MLSNAPDCGDQVSAVGPAELMAEASGALNKCWSESDLSDERVAVVRLEGCVLTWLDGSLATTHQRPMGRVVHWFPARAHVDSDIVSISRAG